MKHTPKVVKPVPTAQNDTQGRGGHTADKRNADGDAVEEPGETSMKRGTHVAGKVQDGGSAAEAAGATVKRWEF